MNFFINKNATLPHLKLELINNGRNDFHKFMYLIQNSEIFFCMYDIKTGNKKISMAPASCEHKIYNCGENQCEDIYYLVYKWKKRDTKTSGIFKGEFIINIGGDLLLLNNENRCFFNGNECETKNGIIPDSGKLIVPIREELFIYINDGTIKK